MRSLHTEEIGAAMPGDAKALNRQRMLRVISAGDVLTAAQIHQETGISRQTVMRTLQHYCQMGVIKSVGFGASTSAGGKKPELFRFCDERKILCVNLWPETITLGMCGLIGNVYHVTEYPHQLSDDLDENLEHLYAMAKTYLADMGISLEQLYGVALSVPGTVDYRAESLRYNSQAPGWGTDVALTAKLRSVMGEHLQYYVDNAGKAAGRALLMEHPEYEHSRAMTFFTTWGVSSCLIEKGHILNGKDSLIGEIGHMIISDTDEVVCGCGKRGCLESMVSLTRVRRLLRENGEPADVSECITFEQLFAKSAAGEAPARAVVKYLAHCFAVALQNLSLGFNQEKVIFQGDFALADEHFDQCLKEELQQFRYYPRGGLFSIEYDRRSLSELAAKGAAGKLRAKYFMSLV
ncbi:MAG: ROK family transcriptional regulator [Clostridia bacterium]|nr:ROK family transcriptional regulator [Clostridia bacterium]